MTALPEERLGQLRVSKLLALVAARSERAGESDGATVGPGPGAAVADSSPMGTGAAARWDDGAAAVLVEEAGRRSLGGAITWAIRRGAESLLVIVDADIATASALAREAAEFAFPIAVERIAGTTCEAVGVAPPQSVSAPFDPKDPAVASLVALLANAGVDLMVEHGVIKGEVLGLEVARVVDDAEGTPTMEVGVGRFDREISSMMFSNIPTVDALAKAATMVREYRRPGATTHPLRDLVPERWLRHVVLAQPELVGAATLVSADTTLEPESLRERQPAAMVGVLTDGRAAVVVCTAGIDLDVVPLAADTRAFIDPDAELIICGPARSLVDATRAVGARLKRPATFVEVELPY